MKAQPSRIADRRQARLPKSNSVGSPQNYLAWYAIYTHSQQEMRTIRNLMAWGVEAFTPWLRPDGTTRGPQVGAVPQALFPRYVFARFDLEAMLNRIRYTRGVHSIVSAGGLPIVVDDSVIALCKSRDGADGYVMRKAAIKMGERVIVTAGALKGLAGAFERELPERERVTLLLTTISYQARVSVQSGEIMKATAAAAA